jgi:hypothetical protein
VGKETVGQQEDLRGLAEAPGGRCGALRITMMEKVEDGFGFQHSPRIEKADVGAFVDERVREFAGQHLGDDEIGQIAVRDQHGSLHAEESGQCGFELLVERMIPRRLARGSDVQAKFFQPVAYGREHGWV